MNKNSHFANAVGTCTKIKNQQLLLADYYQFKF